MKLVKSLHWGSMPWEFDGGAVVNYYLLKALHKIRPDHKFYCLPKVFEEADPKSLPFSKYLKIMPDDIPKFMAKNEIPILNMFHISEDYFPIVKPIREIGGKTIIHQTIHWTTDMVFTSDILKDVDYWVAPTKWAKKVLKEVGGIQDERIEYIPHGVSLDDFSPHITRIRRELKLNKDQKIILFVGRCSMLKGIHQLIPVIRPLIHDYNCIFIIRANKTGEKAKEISFMFDKFAHQFPKNVIFNSEWNPPEFMHELMATPDILVQTSTHEGFDVPLIEAMACKIPIAVTNIPNHWEILGEKNRYCGLFMEPTVPIIKINEGRQEVKVPSSDVIEGTLRFLLENPEECKIMGENGYNRVKEEYDLEKVANKWFKLMDSVIKNDT